MTLSIDLSPEDEGRLIAAATVQGLSPAELARKLLSKALPSTMPSSDQQDPTLALFTQWDAEDSAMTPDEVEVARREFEEFKRHINEERRRAGARIVYP